MPLMIQWRQKCINTHCISPPSTLGKSQLYWTVPRWPTVGDFQKRKWRKWNPCLRYFLFFWLLFHTGLCTFRYVFYHWKSSCDCSPCKIVEDYIDNVFLKFIQSWHKINRELHWYFIRLRSQGFWQKERYCLMRGGMTNRSDRCLETKILSVTYEGLVPFGAFYRTGWILSPWSRQELPWRTLCVRCSRE